jgi:hypothetical protein
MSDRMWQHREGKYVPEAAGEFDVAAANLVTL